MENVGSEVTLWKVPARPSAQWGPTYTLSLRGIWVQCVAAQASFFVEARSLVSDAPTWNKRSSEILVVTRGAFACSGEESYINHQLGKSSNTRVVCLIKYLIEPCEWLLECFYFFKVRDHPNSVDAPFPLVRVITRVHVCLLGEGAPETL